MPEGVKATVTVAGADVTFEADAVGRYADVPDPAALLAAREREGLVYRATAGLPLTATTDDVMGWLGGLVDAGGFSWPVPIAGQPAEVTLVDLAVGTTGFVALSLLLDADRFTQLDVPAGLGGLLRADTVGIGTTYRGTPVADPAIAPDDDIVTLVEQLG